MAMLVVDSCINCAACEPECPNDAIAPGEPVYVIDTERCTECVGAHDAPRCVEVCPVDCIVPDPAHRESQDELLRRYASLHA